MQKVLPLAPAYAGSHVVDSKKRGTRFVKRMFDMLVSLCMLVVLLPILLVVAVIAAVDTKGSPLFIQERMGRNGKPFRMVKFRTMSVQAPANVATHQLVGAEQYISKVGGLLRKLSLDELPQLWNIFKGDMSFVGPRPVVLTENDLLDLRAKNGALSVRPGLTGLAQVNGRDTVTVVQKACLDGIYARNVSVKMDLRILCKTVGYVLHSRGICEGANPKIAASVKRERSA